MEEKSIYERRIKLLTNDVDFMKRIKPSGILNIFQEIAGTHAEELGVGFDAMSNKGMFWVLSRIKFEIEEFPVYEQEVLARTWPALTGPVYFERDYEILNLSGKVLIRATAVWCVLDFNTHALIPGKSLDGLFQVKFLERRAMTEKIGKIISGGEPEKRVSRQILPGDLDFNFHANNTRYADFTTDCFEVNFLKEHPVKSMQIHYLQEGRCGDDLEITVSKSENSSIVQGECAGKAIFISKVIFH